MPAQAAKPGGHALLMPTQTAKPGGQTVLKPAQAAKPGGHALLMPAQATETGGHALLMPSKAAKPGGHARPGFVAPIEGHSKNTPLLSNIKKRKSGPSFGRMGFLNAQFKGHEVGGNTTLVPAMISQVGGSAKVKDQVRGHAPLVPAMVTQVGGSRPKYTASRLSKKGYRLSQSGHNQDEGHAHNEGHTHNEGHAHNKGHTHNEGHAHDAQLRGYVDSGSERLIF